MFDNACLLTVSHRENSNTSVHFWIPPAHYYTSEPSSAPRMIYQLWFSPKKLNRTISDEFSTCLRSGEYFLEIGSKAGKARLCSIFYKLSRFPFQLPEKAVDFLRYGSGSRSFLCYDHYTYPKMDFTYAQPVLRKIAKIPEARRALCKAMKTSFRWPDTCEDHEIRFYSDGGLNFFWREFYGDKPGISGGLIYSEYNGRSEYSVHT